MAVAPRTPKLGSNATTTATHETQQSMGTATAITMTEQPTSSTNAAATYMAEQTPATTVLGKRKERSQSNDDNNDVQKWHRKRKVLENRVVITRQVATRRFNISAFECPYLLQYLEALRKQVPILVTKLLATKTLFHRRLSTRMVLLLQETGGKKQRHRKYTTIGSDYHQGYRDWYVRNVVNGKEDKLRIEVHVLNQEEVGGRDTADFEADMRAAELGGEARSWLKMGYHRILEDIDKWDLGNRDPFGVPLQDMDWEVIKHSMVSTDVLHWPATTNWFPARPKDRVGKNEKAGQLIDSSSPATEPTSEENKVRASSRRLFSHISHAVWTDLLSSHFHPNRTLHPSTSEARTALCTNASTAQHPPIAHHASRPHDGDTVRTSWND